MRVVLHIGMEKTGTTAVQHWLNEQRNTLREEGWHVPTSLGKTNHRQLSLLGFDKSRRDDATYRRQINKAEELLELQQQIKERLKQEIKKGRAHGCHTLIASSELISSRLTQKKEKVRLLEAIADSGAKGIEVILVTRNAADLAESRHTTAILHELRTENHPPKPGTAEADLFGKQKQLYEQWQAACREINVLANVILFKYEVGIVNYGSICTMLASFLGMSEEVQSKGLRTRKNEKLPTGSLNILKIINHCELCLRNIFGRSRKRQKVFDQIRKKIAGIKIGRKQYKMPNKLREEYNNYYK